MKYTFILNSYFYFYFYFLNEYFILFIFWNTQQSESKKIYVER